MISLVDGVLRRSKHLYILIYGTIATHMRSNLYTCTSIQMQMMHQHTRRGLTAVSTVLVTSVQCLVRSCGFNQRGSYTLLHFTCIPYSWILVLIFRPYSIVVHKNIFLIKTHGLRLSSSKCPEVMLMTLASKLMLDNTPPTWNMMTNKTQ